MTMKTLRPALLLALCLPLALPASAAEKVSRQARALHERILVLDSHLDTPAMFDDPAWDILERHTAGDGKNQIDYPRMKEGGLDGGLWAVYTPQNGRGTEANRIARDHGLKRLIGIKQLLAAHPDKFELALTPEDAPRIAKSGKRIVYISMENASPLASDPSLLQFYYDQGLRVLGLVHTSTTTSPIRPTWRRSGMACRPRAGSWWPRPTAWGILLDQSHASDEVFDQLLELSKAPIVLTHTSADALRDHARNIDDARIRRLAEKGGVIQVNSYCAPTWSPPAGGHVRGLHGACAAHPEGGRTRITWASARTGTAAAACPAWRTSPRCRRSRNDCSMRVTPMRRSPTSGAATCCACSVRHSAWAANLRRRPRRSNAQRTMMHAAWWRRLRPARSTPRPSFLGLFTRVDTGHGAAQFIRILLHAGPCLLRRAPEPGVVILWPQDGQFALPGVVDLRHQRRCRHA